MLISKRPDFAVKLALNFRATPRRASMQPSWAVGPLRRAVANPGGGTASAMPYLLPAADACTSAFRKSLRSTDMENPRDEARTRWPRDFPESEGASQYILSFEQRALTGWVLQVKGDVMAPQCTLAQEGLDEIYLVASSRSFASGNGT